MKNLFTFSLLLCAQILFSQEPLSFNEMEILVDQEAVGDQVIFKNVATVDDEMIDMYATIIETSSPVYIQSMNFGLDYDDEFKFMLKDNNAGPGTEIWAKVEYRFVKRSDQSSAYLSFNLVHADLDFHSTLIKESVEGNEAEMYAFCLDTPTRLDQETMLHFKGTTFTNPLNAQTAVQFEYVDQSVVHVIYKTKKYNSTSSNSSFMVDGNGSLIEFYDMDRTLLDDPLPVELASFTASAPNKERVVKLNWRSVNEINLDFYEVQRSFDGIHFVSIGKQDPLIGEGPKEYSFIDLDIKNNNQIYYRIKMVDLDKSEMFSDIKGLTLMSKNSTVLSIFPNPSAVQVNIKSEINIKAVEIVDLRGNIALKKRDLHQLDTSLDVRGLLNGQYIAKVLLENGHQEIKKWMKF